MYLTPQPLTTLPLPTTDNTLLEKLLFIDLETTGATLGYDRITEIGMVWYTTDKGWQTASSLVNPGIRIPAKISELTGITDAMVAQAPPFSALQHELSDLLAERILVAHNVRFDYGFLSREFARCDQVLGLRHLCTLRLSRLLQPEQEKHGLATLAQRWSLALENHHRALDDALALAQLWQCWQQNFGLTEVTTLARKAIRDVNLPPQIEREDLLSLPDGPGVYLFYGEQNNLLYIGKSIDLRSRVFSHFSDALHNSKEAKIVQQARRIEHICCAGDLGAQLLESQLIKQHQPLYNRKLRRKRALQTWQLNADPDGYLQPVLTPLDSVPIDQISQCYGMFSKTADARKALEGMVRKHQLCQVKTGLENRNGPCFGRQLNQCAGACCGEESAQRFNLRLKLALSSQEIAWWPFDGVLCVKEHSDINNLSQWHLLYQWRYLGSTPEAPTQAPDDHQIASSAFDVDAYRILQRELRRFKPEQVHVLPLPSA